jgi:single-stranded DNA-binding protein
MNRVHLIGTLVWSVEVSRDRSTGQPVAKAMLAVTDGAPGLDFVPVALHGNEATDAANYLGEGSLIYVMGHLHSVLRHERDSDGTEHTRRTLHVIADQVAYLTICPPRGGDRA